MVRYQASWVVGAGGCRLGQGVAGVGEYRQGQGAVVGVGEYRQVQAVGAGVVGYHRGRVVEVAVEVVGQIPEEEGVGVAVAVLHCLLEECIPEEEVGEAGEAGEAVLYRRTPPHL